MKKLVAQVNKVIPKIDLGVSGDIRTTVDNLVYSTEKREFEVRGMMPREAAENFLFSVLSCCDAYTKDESAWLEREFVKIMNGEIKERKVIDQYGSRENYLKEWR